MASTVDAERVREYNEEADSAVFNRKLDRLAEMVRASKYTVFFTGAGVSTSAGVGDYRGPSGAWTKRRIKELQHLGTQRTREDEAELKKLLEEMAREEKKAKVKVDMMDAQPTPTHMTMATLIRLGLAHYCITTNLDGLFRKAGLRGHEQLCCLHGDVYIERCTACGYDFERNYHVRQDFLHVHDHFAGACTRCGSKKPAHYTGTPGDAKMKKSRWGGRMVGTRDTDCGTKDTHINFGEMLDEIDWNEADLHCSKADLCIIAGTSMSLRHITHFPFQAKQVVLINLQATPDDDKADLRIWAKCDPVFEGLMERLGLEIDPIPVWRPRDYVPLNKIPGRIHPYYKSKAKELDEMIRLREAEAEDRRKEAVARAALARSSLASAGRSSSSDESEEMELADPEAESSETPKKKNKLKEKNKKNKNKSEASAIGSLPPAIEVGNLHQQINSQGSNNSHQWTVFVKLPEGSDDGNELAELVEAVEFDLHPTFSPAQVRVDKAPFKLTRIGWGTFDVGVTVHWKKQLSKKPSHFTHHLSFRSPKSSVSIPVA